MIWDLFVNMEGLAGWVGGNFREYGHRCGVGNNCGPCYKQFLATALWIAERNLLRA